ncbi:MAG: OmpA family protein [Lamprocystis purpurea]|jgi:outer membrane protein OmpA-like peptidoglycan-associated protein|uniref:OmpA family protein n=1 Tax=Lamprocystis purpurea TaxID=61598 RepID=UPI00036D79C1|nr:OmpA family protein [Lamprocystis purpurea]MBV5274487.1 OmpA family protein [Lamprocystis purpurea]
MSEPTPAERPWLPLAPIALVLLFGAGLLLAYLIDPAPIERHPTPETTDARTGAALPPCRPTTGDTELPTLRQRVLDLEQTIADLGTSHAAALAAARGEAAAALATAEASVNRCREEAGQLRQTAELGARVTDRGLQVTLAETDLRFKPGQGTLPSSVPDGLKRMAAFLEQNPRIQVQVEGHTDSKGDAKANLSLSTQRAESVKAALAALGIAADRITATGKGETQPIAGNQSEDGRSRNRRVEVLLIEP